MPGTIESPSIDEVVENLEKSSEDIDRPWLVVVYDDPVNTMNFVTMVFEKVLSMPHATAERKMWEVHNKGRSIVWEGGREPAEVILQQLHLYGLQARLEKTEVD